MVRDWLEYPASVTLIEELWTDVDYLYFNEQRDAWYYQLTREDLARLKMSLVDVLKPTYEVIRGSADFKVLLQERPRLQAEAADLKQVITSRIRDPKQLMDLLSW